MGKSDFIFKYRIRNWPEYNRALVGRGSLTFWIDEQAVSAWRNAAPVGVRGRPRIYTDTAIECALVVKAVFHLSLRATEGFLASVVKLMGVELPVPDYSTVSRRQTGLEVGLRVASGARPRHVVVDTTGLKVFGAGEWYVRKYWMGRGRRRIWRKLHVGVDETTKEIVVVDLTPSNIHDARQLPRCWIEHPVTSLRSRPTRPMTAGGATRRSCTARRGRPSRRGAERG
ncbi:MAG: IS5 family transposase [Gammaproteobacteria bacterium]|nr:IS5 family transposase [Gammaproteobacteria bacterium]